jgi:hypothetical protein
MDVLSLLGIPRGGGSPYTFFCLQIFTLTSLRTHNSPSDLVERIKDAHAKDEVVLGVSVASNGDWFLSTNAFNSKSTSLVTEKRNIHI